MSATEFSRDILETHNKYRANHGVPALIISDKLNKFAQEWAEKLGSKDKTEHRPDNPYGENLYMAGSTDPNWKLKGETVVKSWYDEIKLYKFGQPSPNNSSEVGHFTQLVWKGTAELGIGEAKSKTGKVYVVCNYDPPGNVLREFEKNVFPLHNATQNGNGNRQSMEDLDGAEREEIVLTPSQEKMGIRFVQPNIQIVESMKRLYAVPSEKIRVWSVWLTKVEEEANEWHCWLRSHINLVLRMSEYLKKVEEEVDKEEKWRDDKIIVGVQDASTGVRKRRVDGLYREGDEEHVEKAPGAADAGQGSEGLSQGTRKVDNRETVRFQERNGAIVDGNRTQLPSAAVSKQVDEEAAGIEEAPNGEDGAEPSGAETMSSGGTMSLKEENNGDANDRNREQKRKSSDGERENERRAEELEKIAWPIGVPWERAKPASRKEQEVPKKKEDDVKVIPIPGNAKDMLRLIKEVKRQATIYGSFYKHWLEVADRAVKEIMNRTVMPSERVLTDEEIPYFFYLYVEPDVEIGVENDDETIFHPDPTREKITCEFTTLYFNLADKPGKGGKPWL